MKAGRWLATGMAGLLCGMTAMAAENAPMVPTRDAGMQPPPPRQRMHEGSGQMMDVGMGPIQREAMLLSRLVNNEQLAKDLALTPEQTNTLMAAAEEMKGKWTSYSEQLKTSADEQVKIITAGKIDEAKLMEAVEKTSAIRTEMAKLTAKQIVVLHGTLTPEQLAKAREMMEKRMERRSQGMEDMRKRWGERREMREGGPQAGQPPAGAPPSEQKPQ